MPTWILATLFAAFMQNLRFLLQRHLKVTTLSTMGATWARFAFAMPFVALALILYAAASGQVPPTPAGVLGPISPSAASRRCWRRPASWRSSRGATSRWGSR
jgi:hypothetical protein